MPNCKTCEHCCDSGAMLICTCLGTHCATTPDPELGTKLARCRYTPAKKTGKKKQETIEEATENGSL